ncbi:MAG TPA: PQQ-binding-like beta-propeller repeat protein [Rhizomicrobium sp.]|nr:PQQ-binding-like beta-propeller repeat protein [Rhizomicrobium sp.]
MGFRSSCLIVILASLAGLTMQDATAAPKSASTSFQIDVAHTGSTQFAKFNTPLKLKWSIQLGGYVSYPIIADGRVFVTVANQDPFDAELVALNLKNGAVLWRTPIPDNFALWSNATYENGLVFVLNSDGAMLAYNGKTGRVRWGVQLQGQYQFASPPIASGGTVFASGIGSGGTIYAIDEKRGKVMWSQNVAGSLFGAPALGDNGLYFSFGCDSYDFNPQTGAQIWHNNYGCSGGSGKTPVYSSQRLYARTITEGNTIFSGVDGTSLGTYNADEPPAFYTDAGGNPMEAVLYNGTLYGLHADTGAQAWTFIGDKFLTSAPLVINGKVIEGSEFGHLYVLDGGTGNVDWKTTISDIYAPDEYTLDQPLTGFGAADGMLVVPAGFSIFAYKSR